MNFNFEPIIRGLKVIFFTETKCKIRFIYARFNCKRKKWGKRTNRKIYSAIKRKGGSGSDAEWPMSLKISIFLRVPS